MRVPKMQKLGFPSMRSLDQFKSLSKSVSGGPPKDLHLLFTSAGVDLVGMLGEFEAHRREIGEGASFCENRSGNGSMWWLIWKQISLLLIEIQYGCEWMVSYCCECPCQSEKRKRSLFLRFKSWRE